ncbi:hypothetical protein AF331_10295 [Rossellomorea marisflavi]|uniref:Squalene--hopene cyclase n=1 Tax=Rossellomorea marisflavi TaxID=189381 RepID=A0A0M0G4T5_9BACI|nr:prenyltransferase/squalene oxidase repeat-containing protein [Rossellomorea marisflavi]KON84446.1 hypothetical protein AF331_10295 [Rossellomorea marisflavi]MCM2588536.1 squalene--hopene cyclase [Rossellomorea marisflavi]
MKKRMRSKLDRMAEQLEQRQNPDGSWTFCFENSPMTDAFMIILLCSLGRREDQWVDKLVERLFCLQTREGTWKLFKDEEEGNLSSTIEAYVALRMSGIKENDERITRAKRFIQDNGGVGKAHSLTRFMLAILGGMKWKKVLPVPIEFVLIPPSSPVGFWDFSSYARAHMAPILLLKSRGYAHGPQGIAGELKAMNREGEERIPDGERHFLNKISGALGSMGGLSSSLKERAEQFTRDYMLERIEPDGTYMKYFSSSFFMIYALLSIGYRKDDPLIEKCVEGLKAMILKTERGYHQQNSPSSIWDTALLSYALQSAGRSAADGSIRKSIQFLQKHQQFRYGDWGMESPVAPGGWGFTAGNTIHPDVDDTSAALRALTSTAVDRPEMRDSWQRGVDFMVGMQNPDGGWPAFEPNKTNELLTLFPINGAEAAAIDPSTPDLTGRALEFLGGYAGLKKNRRGIKKGVSWLKKAQEIDGSWYGRWGVCYIYGTWAAVTGMRAVGVPGDDHHLVLAKQWLEKIQHRGGGWGESCLSDQVKHYIPLSRATISQTAWALDALISLEEEPTPAIDTGMQTLLDLLEEKDDYPTGAGLPGNLYIHYHSYQWIWPMVTISHYLKKYG